jgi:circadian clock protein KaiC
MIVQERRNHRTGPLARGVEKSPTGINGVDEVLNGGLPKGRPTLICGSAGCGKTLFSMEFLVRGAVQFNEPGVFMAFEETEEELTKNVASLGFNLNQLIARKKIALDFVRIERSEISETGEYDLQGLFIRLAYAIDSIRAKRVVLDTIEALFAGLPNEAILRAELRRLFSWLKEKKVTAIITGERGEGTLTRYGLEEYVADCVILLDNRVANQVSTRRLRVVKYRGSLHGTNEYPFLIGKNGISVLPITSLGLAHSASTQRISTGIQQLDVMLGGKGYLRGSTILVSGTAGSGKTSLAAAFVKAACQRGERVLYFAFEESPDQIIRNMRSIGIDLGRCSRKNLLRFHAVRPNIYGLEMHLVAIHDLVADFKPSAIVIDPLTNLDAIGDAAEVKSMLVRLIDFFKTQKITALCTSLTFGGEAPEHSATAISSLMDTWLLLRNLEHAGERNRGLYVLKSRGMAHSNQIREFQLSAKGINLIDVFVANGTVLTGASRVAQQTLERAQADAQRHQATRLQRVIQRKQQATQAQISVLRSALENELEELKQAQEEDFRRSYSAILQSHESARKRMTNSNDGFSTRNRARKSATPNNNPAHPLETLPSARERTFP